MTTPHHPGSGPQLVLAMAALSAIAFILGYAVGNLP